MATEMNAITIKILNRDIKVQCPSDKVRELQESAIYLEEKMMDLVGDNNSKSFNMEKVAIVTALNVVRELKSLKRQDKIDLQAVTNRLRELKNKIEQELAEEI
jgi:cell division protein ZapA